MADSVVDLGAAGEYISEKFDDVVDYFTGAPKARAGSRGFFKDIGPGVRQYYLGPGEKEGESFFEYLGFENGGDVPLQDDGSLPGVDDLRFMTPEEVETGSYNYLQDLEDRLRYHVSEAQNPISTEDSLGIPVKRGIEDMRYHEEEAEMLRDEIERFRDRRARAVLNYPESETKLYMREGQEPYVKGFPDSIVEGYENGGDVPEGIMSVDLGKEADKTGPSGLESFDIYTELAPEQFPRRPIAKQNFGKKRGFQFGQMVQRDEAVSGKLLKQAGIMTPVEVVKQNVDPKVMEQISRIMGRDIV